MVMPRKKRRAIFLSVILIIIAIIVTIVIVLYKTTDMFKSNEMLFSKYTGQLLENMRMIFNQENMAKTEEILQNSKLLTDTIVKVQYNENGNTDDSINDMQINITAQKEKNAGYDYRGIKITQNEQTLLGGEYIEDENFSGIRLNGIRQFLSTNLQNKEENKIKIINNLANIRVRDIVGFIFEESDTLTNKYMGIIIDNMGNAIYSKQSNIDLKIDGQTYHANGYTATLTKEQFNNIYIDILENIKEEEIILTKIENIDKQINDCNNLVQNNKTSTIKQDFISKIEEKLNEIKSTNIGNNQRTITVYESNGIAISLSIDTEENFVGLDVVNINGKNFINLLGNKKIEENEKENGFDLKLEKVAKTNSEEFKITYNTVKEGKTTTNELLTNRKMEDSLVDCNINMNRVVGDNNLTILLENHTQVVDEFEEREKLIENENNIILESLTEEQKQNATDNLKQNMSEQLEQLFQVISLDNIEDILVKMDIIKALPENIENEGTTQAEKNRFNSNFELFEGENIKKERIAELMNIAQGALEDIRITQYKEQSSSSNEKIPIEYKLIINKDIENTELAEQFVDYIENGTDNTFSIRLEYNETTGLVSDIYITVSK